MAIPHTGLSDVDVAKTVRTAESDPRLGVQVAISYDGKVVFQRGYGMANIAAHRAMKTTTPVGIGSITKQFTAAEIMRLVQDHKLHLSDTLTTLLPHEHWPAHITIAELLHHTSGLTTRWSRPAADTDAQTERDVEDAVAEAKPVSSPGSSYTYNNNGYYLLGLIIQRITHNDYPSVVASMVQPLWPGATGASVTCRGATARSEAKAYSADLSGGAQHVVPYPLVLSDGALCATATQLLTWQHALRSGGIVAKSSYATMTRPSSPSVAAGTPYGMGLAIGSHHSIWHDGLMPLYLSSGVGYGGYLVYHPTAKVGIAVLCVHGATVPREVADALWSRIEVAGS